MPRKTKAELIADYEAKLVELRAKDDESKQNKVVKLNKEIATLDERITKLETTKQGKVDERDLLQREIAESASTDAPADASVNA